MSLNTVNNVSIGFEQKNEFLRFPIPAEDVAAVGSGQDEVVSPPRSLLDHGPRVAMAGKLFDAICDQHIVALVFGFVNTNRDSLGLRSKRRLKSLNIFH